MPIYELNYRGWEGERTPQNRRWLTIARTDLSILVKRKMVWFVVILGLLMALSPLASIVVHSRLLEQIASQSDWGGIMNYLANATHLMPLVDAKLFNDFYGTQAFFLFVLALVAGSGRVANDARTNAFLFFLSRPVGKFDYVLGKYAAVAGLLSLVSLLPAMVLLVLAWMVAPELPSAGAASFDLTWRLAGAVLLQGLLTVFYVASGVLLVSAFSRGSRMAGVGFAALVFLSDVIFEIAAALFNSQWAVMISFFDNLHHAQRWIFGLGPKVDFPPAVSLLVVLAVIGAGVLVLASRLKAVEVQT